MPNQDRFDTYDRSCQAKIAEHGWMIQAVGAGDNQPGFAYTIGLTPAGLPELVIAGLSFKLMGTLLNSAAAHTLETEVKAGDVLEGIATTPFRVADASLAEVGMARHLYGRDKVTALQLIWPDQDGRYPGDLGWTLDEYQPLYTAAASSG